MTPKKKKAAKNKEKPKLKNSVLEIEKQLLRWFN